MVKFDFNGLRQENNNVAKELTIHIDDQLYQQGKNYSTVYSLRFENTYGYIIIRGLFNISNLDLLNCLTIDEMSIKFSKELQKCCSYQFNIPTIIMGFFLNERYEKQLYENQNILLNLNNAEILGENKKILEIKTNAFTDINVQQLIEKEEQRKIHERQTFQDEKIILDNDQSYSNIYGGNVINTNKKQDNIINHKFNEKDDVRDIISNPNLSNFQNLNLSNREQDYNFNFNDPKQNSKFFHFDESNININEKNFDEEINEDNIQVDEMQLNNDFVSFDNIQNFHLSEKINEIIDDNLLNQINEKEEKTMKKNFSINGNSIIIVKNNNMINLKEEQLLPNNDLDVYNDDYKKSTIETFINLYEEMLKRKNKDINNLNYDDINNMVIDDNNSFNNEKINKMSVNDYTILINTYISELENKRIQLLNEMNSNKNNKNKIYNFVYRLEREISSLKLFSILFLNCFYPNEKLKEEEIINSENLQVKKIRRKKLTEWLIETQKNNYNVKKDNIKNPHDKIIFSLINGQIIDSIKECRLNNMSMLGLLISQMNNKIKIKTFNKSLLASTGKITFNEKLSQIFLLLAQTHENNSDIFIKNCNWYNLLIQLCLFSVEEYYDISFLMDKLEVIIKDNLNQFKLITPFMDQENTIFDLNYLLLKIYSVLNLDEINNDDLNDLIQMLSYSRNLINNNSCDHHVQYIISSILLDIIKLIYPSIHKQIKLKTLKELTFDLFRKNIEEISLDSKKVNSNFKNIIKLINLSNLNKRLKKKLIEETLTTININDPKELFGENNILSQLDNLALGYYYKNNFDYLNAYKYFEAAKEYNLSADSYILLCLNKLVYNKEEFRPNEIYEVLNQFDSRFLKLEGFNNLFYRYILCITKNVNSEYIVDIINQIFKIYNNGKLITFAKGIMIDDLRKILNYKLNIESDKNNDEYLFSSCCNNLIYDKDIQLNTKINEIKNGIDSIIEFKNLVFSKINE